MVVITHYREKCIGCNYCVEAAPYRWAMSKKDGKVFLLDAQNKKEIYTAKLGDHEWEDAQVAAEVCPVNIIKVKKV